MDLVKSIILIVASIISTGVTRALLLQWLGALEMRRIYSIIAFFQVMTVIFYLKLHFGKTIKISYDSREGFNDVQTACGVSVADRSFMLRLPVFKIVLRSHVPQIECCFVWLESQRA